MNNKIKKISAFVICVVMVVLCTINAGAAKIPTQPTQPSVIEKYSSFKLLNSSINIPNNKLYLSTFNQSGESVSIIKFDALDDTKSSDDSYSFKDYVTGDYISLKNNTKYEVWSGVKKTTGASLGLCGTKDFSNFSGEYQKVRIKLSDFNSYFNSDGSHTNDEVDYHFGLPEKVDDTTYYSSLILFSGQAFTSVTPNKNGEVEFYVSTKIGVSTSFTTDFGFTTSHSSGGGGGTCREIVICKGNAKTNNSYVSIDDATHIQLYIADMLDETFTDLQKFNADANNDGVIDIKDATYIQFYLADLI